MQGVSDRGDDRFEGIVLRRRIFSETSQMVTWLTRERGLCTTVMRGAGHQGNPFIGLDLYQSVKVVITPGKRGGVHRAKEIEITQRRTGLGGMYVRLLGAACFGDWIERLLEPEHAEPEVYELLQMGLDWLESNEPRLAAVERFENKLASLLGHGLGDGCLGESVHRLGLAGHGVPRSRREFMEALGAL